VWAARKSVRGPQDRYIKHGTVAQHLIFVINDSNCSVTFYSFVTLRKQIVIGNILLINNLYNLQRYAYKNRFSLPVLDIESS